MSIKRAMTALLSIIWAALVLLGWKKRTAILGLLPISESFPLYPAVRFTFCALLLLLGAVGLLALVQFARTPILLKSRWRRAVERSGLWNAQRETPELLSVRPDPNKAHGLIFKVDGKGLSPADFERRADRLETGLGGQVYALEYGRKTSQVLVYLLPHKYAVPFALGVNAATAERFLDLPNLLTVGATGTGKSYFLLTLLGVYAKYAPDVSITVCDYKKSSFAQFEDTTNFYGYNDVPDGIRRFYQEFTERLEANDPDRNRHIRVLLIDEYGALISAQDKKLADELKTMVANMLFMGRSLGCRVLIGVQRADAEHFKAGARDQFKAVLGLGNLSAEQKQMLFRECKDRMAKRNGLGEGYLLIDGQELEQIKVAELQDEGGLNESIRKAMCR